MIVVSDPVCAPLSCSRERSQVWNFEPSHDQVSVWWRLKVAKEERVLDEEYSVSNQCRRQAGDQGSCHVAPARSACVRSAIDNVALDVSPRSRR